VNEGDEVVLNPRTLLSDKEKHGTKEDEKMLPGSGKQGGARGGPDSRGGRGGEGRGGRGGVPSEGSSGDRK
jgi:hypothetical protein